MDLLIVLIELGLDAGILALCSEAVFRSRDERKLRDLLIFPILFVLCVIPNVDLVVGTTMSASLSGEGLEILPADDIVGVLFLVLAVLLLHSFFFRPRADKTIFCGTMMVFAVFLSVRSLWAVIFAVCGAAGDLLLLGSRIAAACSVVLLGLTPFFEHIRTLVQRSDFTDMIVSSDITVLMTAGLAILSFDVTGIMTHLWLIIILVLVVLLVDSVLLLMHHRRIQERRRVRMIEQHVPIVEELISQVRARQHEFNNRLMAIEAAVSSAETLEEARREVAALTGNIGISVNDRELLSCDSKIIAGMLFGKIKQAEAAGLHIELSLHGLFKKTVTPETEWIEAIGILLDNAIEASPKGSTIYLSTRRQGDLLELTVSDPSRPMSNTEFMALFEKGVTTKGDKDGHGFGLYNILRMTERYHGKILARNEIIAGKDYVVFGILMP